MRRVRVHNVPAAMTGNRPAHRRLLGEPPFCRIRLGRRDERELLSRAVIQVLENDVRAEHDDVARGLVRPEHPRRAQALLEQLDPFFDEVELCTRVEVLRIVRQVTGDLERLGRRS